MEKVLNDGFVNLIDFMGSDQRVLQAARVSTGAESKGEEKDRGLINYLMKNKHMTPFEKVVFEFHVRCPIFIARQWFRHRMGSFNEESARYKEFEWSTWEPENWRKQDIKNRQVSIEELDFNDTISDINHEVNNVLNKSKETYEELLNLGVAREQARAIMPVGQYTEFYWTVNFRSLMNFLSLRNHEHAQPEIQAYAQAIEKVVSSLQELTYSWGVFTKMRRLDHIVLEAVNKYKTLDNLINYLELFNQVGK